MSSNSNRAATKAINPNPSSATRNGSPSHRVVIVGCGFGGLQAARELGDASLAVTVIDRTNHHLFQPLLYQVATGVLSEGDIAPPTREVLRKQENTQVMLGEVRGIDLTAKVVTVETIGGMEAVNYDSLIVATGSRQSYFGHNAFARHAPGMKTIDDALELRGRIFGAFELAEREADEQRRQERMTFAVVGAGTTGVELAGQLAELSRRSLVRNFRQIDPRDARVVLLDAADSVLPSFPASLRERARKDLRGLGVDIRLRTRVTGVDATGLDLQPADGQPYRLDAMTKIWAAGVEASPLGRLLGEASGTKVDRTGRPEVLPDCTLIGHPEVFVIGDLMSLNHLPGVAQVAIQSGRHAAQTIRRRLRGDSTARPFMYRDRGTLATIARFRAVAAVGRFRFSGGMAWLVWLLVHIAVLTGFKNRLAAAANWGFAFLGRGRRQRTITVQQVFARQALSAAERPPLSAE